MATAPSTLFYGWNLATPHAITIAQVMLQVCSRAGLPLSAPPHLAAFGSLSGSDSEEVILCLGKAVLMVTLCTAPPQPRAPQLPSLQSRDQSLS